MAGASESILDEPLFDGRTSLVVLPSTGRIPRTAVGPGARHVTGSAHGGDPGRPRRPGPGRALPDGGCAAPDPRRRVHARVLSRPRTISSSITSSSTPPSSCPWTIGRRPPSVSSSGPACRGVTGTGIRWWWSPPTSTRDGHSRARAPVCVWCTGSGGSLRDTLDYSYTGRGSRVVQRAMVSPVSADELAGRDL